MKKALMTKVARISNYQGYKMGINDDDELISLYFDSPGLSSNSRIFFWLNERDGYNPVAKYGDNFTNELCGVYKKLNEGELLRFIRFYSSVFMIIDEYTNILGTKERLTLSVIDGGWLWINISISIGYNNIVDDAYLFTIIDNKGNIELRIGKHKKVMTVDPTDKTIREKIRERLKDYVFSGLNEELGRAIQKVIPGWNGSDFSGTLGSVGWEIVEKENGYFKLFIAFPGIGENRKVRIITRPTVGQIMYEFQGILEESNIFNWIVGKVRLYSSRCSVYHPGEFEGKENKKTFSKRIGTQMSLSYEDIEDRIRSYVRISSLGYFENQTIEIIAKRGVVSIIDHGFLDNLRIYPKDMEVAKKELIKTLKL